jgi:hypothetical protein
VYSFYGHAQLQKRKKKEIKTRNRQTGKLAGFNEIDFQQTIDCHERGNRERGNANNKKIKRKSRHHHRKG